MDCKQNGILRFEISISGFGFKLYMLLVTFIIKMRRLSKKIFIFVGLNEQRSYVLLISNK